MSTAQASGVDPLNFWSVLVVAIEVEEAIGSGAHGAWRADGNGQLMVWEAEVEP